MSAKGLGWVVWLTGLPRSGKSTLAEATRKALLEAGRSVVVLDGDAVRAALEPSPGYDEAGRAAFYTTLGRLAALVSAQGPIVLVPATAHLRRFRAEARQAAGRFLEVHVATPLEACRAQDPEGLYARGPAGLPGLGVAYEAPECPDVLAQGGRDAEAVQRILVLTA